MSTVTTCPILLNSQQIGAVRNAYAMRSLRGGHVDYLTYPLDPPTLDPIHKYAGSGLAEEWVAYDAMKTQRLVNVMVASLVINSMQRASSDESSRPLPEDQRDSLCELRTEQPIYDEGRADFYEPIQFNWSRSTNRIRNLARMYSEHTHADYSAHRR